MEGIDMNNYPMPYGYQPPQYPQYPYDPRLERLQALDTRMKEMEARLYGNSNNPYHTQENVPPQSYSGNGSGGNTQSNPQGPAIIAVQSEEEAFRDPPNIDGSKQIYTDSKNGLPAYAKWFDANIPKTFRKKAVWVDIGEETAEQPTKSGTESDITPAITALSEKVSAMEESINGMMDEFDEISAYIRKLTASAKRSKNGQFAKKEESEDGK